MCHPTLICKRHISQLNQTNTPYEKYNLHFSFSKPFQWKPFAFYSFCMRSLVIHTTTSASKSNWELLVALLIQPVRNMHVNVSVCLCPVDRALSMCEMCGSTMQIDSGLWTQMHCHFHHKIHSIFVLEYIHEVHGHRC